MRASQQKHWVCWSIEMQLRNGGFTAVHVQGKNGRTLCGIPYGVAWDFDRHDNVTCLRCKRILRNMDRSS